MFPEINIVIGWQKNIIKTINMDMDIEIVHP